MIVTVLYDFNSDIANELSIIAGEKLNVTDTDVGNGWWEGTNSKGRTGIFPASYVEKVESVAKPAPPPAPASADTLYSNDAWNTSSAVVAPSFVSQNTQQAAAPAGHRYDSTEDAWNNQDDYDSEFDDDRYAEIPNNPTQQSSNYRSSLPQTPADDTTSMASTNVHGLTRKTSKMFSKSNDSYIMGTATITVPENEQVFIFMSEVGYFWKAIESNYKVTVTSPTMESKFKGIKKFIAYQLTPTFNNEPVSRRYKNFDWLHLRLVEKFSLIPIPPLPDKQISGRYEEQFIEHRRVQLQEFVDWVCRHPVLSICEVWMHFLTCKDQKKWKVGKRIAEKDALVGPSFCASIKITPDKQLLQSQVDMQIEGCKSFVNSMDNAVKMLESISTDQCSKYTNLYRKDYQRVGEGFSELAKALEIDERRVTTNVCLSNSVGNVAGIFISIGKMFEDQVKHDWQPFSDSLHIYRGILSGFPEVLSEHKNAMQKRKECEKLAFDQKMSNLQIQEVNRRTDVMTVAVMAEQQHFRNERDTHLKQTIHTLLAEQVQFYQKIVQRLQTAQQFFE